MKILQLVAGFATLLFLAACGGEDLDQFVGRWTLEGKGSILQISKVEKNSLQVENTYMLSYEIQRDTAFAKVEDGIMTIGQGMLAQSFRYDESIDRLIGPAGTYRKVPDGWMWRDPLPDE